MTRFGSRIDPKSNPFAWIGERASGTTIHELHLDLLLVIDNMKRIYKMIFQEIID